MGLSRKRAKELKRLKRTTAELWEDQKNVLEHATKVVREASRQLANVSREEVAPKVRDVYESRVRPGVASGLNAGRQLADTTRRLGKDIMPSVSAALGSALTALEMAKDPKVREAMARIRQSGSKAMVVPARSSHGPGRYILMGVGLVAAAGVAYAAWQTLRADDELWVGDSPELDGPEVLDEL